MHLKYKSRKVKRPDWTLNQYRNLNKLWLDKNENSDEILARQIKKIFNKIKSDRIYSYPNLAPLYYKLSKILRLDPKNILLTAGSDAGIKTVFETFIDKNNVVLRTNPTFAMYSVYSKVFGTKEVLLNYYKTKSGPKIDLKKIISTILKRKPKLVCIPNPDSPTGNFFKIKEIEILLNKARNVGSLVLIDEAYYPFYPYTCVKLLKKYKNLIITRTTAKAWGLAGMRVGYVISSKKNIKEMHKVKPMYEVNNVGATLFSSLLEKKKLIDNSVKRLMEGKLYFRKELRKLGFAVFAKEEGNFIHVDFKKYRKKIIKKLSKNIYFRHKENHKSLKNFSRFSITNKKNFETIIEKIKKNVR